MTALQPHENKFHTGAAKDGKHYWLTPWADPEFVALRKEFLEYGDEFFDPCPYPKPDSFDGLTCEWGPISYVNPPFGAVLHQGPDDKKPKKKGMTAWARKCIVEWRKGKTIILVFPLDKWILEILSALDVGEVRNLRDVRWLATEDGSKGDGTGRHIACFIFRGRP